MTELLEDNDIELQSNRIRDQFDSILLPLEKIVSNPGFSDTQVRILLLAAHKPIGYKFWVSSLDKLLTCGIVARKKAMAGLAQRGYAKLIYKSDGKSIKSFWQISTIPLLNKDSSIGTKTPSVEDLSDISLSVVIENKNAELGRSVPLEEVQRKQEPTEKTKDKKGGKQALTDILPVRVAKIPKLMQGYRKWVYWLYEDKNGSYTKIPYQDVGLPAKVNDKQTWRWFKNVQDWQQKGFSGIGFVLSENDPFTIIDLDKCFTGNIISQSVGRIVKYFDSYTEVSPSGRGLHIIVHGEIKKAVKTEKFEIYYDKRYMCMTGEIYWNKPIKDCQKQLDVIAKKYLQKIPTIPINKKGNGEFIMPTKKIPEGERNNKIAKWAGVLSSKAIDEQEYYTYLYQINNTCCTPPLNVTEVTAIGKSIRRYQI